MIFLAILRDSLRETVAVRVIPFLVPLFVFVTTFVASIGFEPLPRIPGLQTLASNFFGASRAWWDTSSPPVRYQVLETELREELPTPWQGTHRFQLVASDDADFPNAFPTFVCLARLQHHPDDMAAKELAARMRVFQLVEQAKTAAPRRLHGLVDDWLAEQGAQVTPRQMEEFIADQFAGQGGFDTVEVKTVTTRAGAVTFAVELRGTPNSLRCWPHSLSLGFGVLPTPLIVSLGEAVLGIEQEIIGTNGGAFVMFVATIITGFFIPGMLRKGRIELLLSRPIRRSTLLLCKFAGGITFMFFNTALLLGAVWICVGLRTGLWPTGFLLAILILTFQFALLFAVSCLVAVLTRSAFAAILASFLTWAALFVIGMSYLFVESTHDLVPLPDWTDQTIARVHLVAPRYKDLDALIEFLLARDLLSPGNPRRLAMAKACGRIDWAESVGVSSAFVVLMLGLACWRFSARDY